MNSRSTTGLKARTMIARAKAIPISELMEMLTELRKRHDAVDIIVDTLTQTVILDPVFWEEIKDDDIDKMIT
jgi:hypothetical protein